VDALVTFARGRLRGTIAVPGDKSISHRALILQAFLGETLTINNLNAGRDVRATAAAVRQISAERREPKVNKTLAIDCMNSGSTARMLMGVCAGANLSAAFDGDASLRARPMEPVAAQLRAFGARINCTDGRLPATVLGTATPQTRAFILIEPSAQVKSAILFAGLFAGVPVAIHGDRSSRDHTERLLGHLGAQIVWNGRTVTLDRPPARIVPIAVPGDFSAACFFIVAATVAPGSDVRIEGVGVNPTRTGLLDALRSMGADITLHEEREQSGEPVADIVVRHAPLRATSIGGELALRSIDEIPLIAVAAAFAEGTTKINGVRELQNKESDRLAAIVRLLDAAGVSTERLPNGIAIVGGRPHSQGATLVTHGDHRTAMAAAALAAGAGPIALDSADSIDVSFPQFLATFAQAQS
jgi:3-phosphoshikimate 1-carboxyvinyltransferase